MRTSLDHFSVIQHYDLITVTDRGQTVRDYDAGDSSVRDRADRVVLCLGVQCGCRFIQDDDRRILCKDSRKLQPLALTARHVISALCQTALIAAFTFHDVLMDLGISGGKYHFIVFDRTVPHADIVRDRIFKQDDILVYHCK